MSNFHPLEVWIAVARHNFKWVKNFNVAVYGLKLDKKTDISEVERLK